MTVTRSDIQFIYDNRLANYLIHDKELEFLVFAIHPKTHNKFWVFTKSSELNSYLKEWKERKYK